MDKTEEQQLVQEFLRTGSELLFRKLYRAHTTSLYRLAFRLLNGNTTAAEDVIQEVWIRGIAGFKNFRWQSGLRTWLSGITVNCCKEHYRANPQSQTTLDSAENKEGPGNNKEHKLDIQKALAQLPDGYREVFILHDMEGYKHNEISEMLGINEGTSKSQLSHARNSMKKLIIN